MAPQQILPAEYTYHLPSAKIALHPLSQRDASKLLVYKNGIISEDIYQNIDQYLPENSLLVFNNTKVIKARLLFTKATGGVIEIFLLEPYKTDYVSALTGTNGCQWKCLIGGASKWKEGGLRLEISGLWLEATLIEKLPDAYVAQLNWTENIPFAEILEKAGNIPLPPYIKRTPDAEDSRRYQTVYAKEEGSVAAPTAGLHFTKSIFEKLLKKNISTQFVTLHVGAGTFKPVKAAVIKDHEMHAEWIEVTAACIEHLLANTNNTTVAVGTTSLRTLESIYWLGVKAALKPNVEELSLLQWEVYEAPLSEAGLSVTEALHSLLGWMKKNNKNSLFTSTQIIIVPGYNFKIAKALVTNFHQPQSTLLLLVAAAVGNKWKDIYQYALENNFRFLSYGDGSLVWIH